MPNVRPVTTPSWPSREIGTWRDLADLLRDQIRSGELPPGAPVPSEAGLGRSYGVGRELVRRAMRALRAEGLIEAVSGQALRVRPLLPVTQVVVPAGTTVRSRMPSPAERAELGRLDGVPVPEGVPVLHVIRPDGTGDLFAADRTEVVFGAEDESGPPSG